MPVEMTPPGKVTPGAIRQVIREESRGALREVIAKAHLEVLARMARHRKTGHMMRATYAKVITDGDVMMGVLGNPLAYTRYLEEGTGLYGPKNHWIVPKRAQVLRWPNMGGGGFTLGGRQRAGKAGQNAEYIFARRVRGIRPIRMFRDAELVVEPFVHRIMEEHAQIAAWRLSEMFTARGAV